MAGTARLRIGTRGSRLARWQAEWVAARLGEATGIDVELVEIRTVGDRTQRSEQPIASIASPGAFTKEIQRALLDGRVDVAVHSLKDLPTDPIPGLCLAAVPARAPTADVLVSRDNLSLDQLPQGAVIGTGSLRRRTQLWHVRPDLRMREIRGNVETRLGKLTERPAPADTGAARAGEDAAPTYDAVVLAEAGLRRLGLQDRITQVLPSSILLPAVGQGALGIETRADDDRARRLVASLDDPPSRAAVAAERALLAALEGGCLAPVAAWARQNDADRLQLDAVVLSPDGKQRLAVSQWAEADDEPETLGRRVAEQLRAAGADRLIEAARREASS